MSVLLFYRRLLVVHSWTWWSFIGRCTAWPSTRTNDYSVFLSILWLSRDDLATLGLHSSSILMTIMKHFTAWLHVGKTVWVVSLRTHTWPWRILLDVAVGNLDRSIPKWLKNWLRVSCRTWLVVLMLLRVLTIIVDLRKWITVSNDHTMVVWKHILMVVSMLCFIHP